MSTTAATTLDYQSAPVKPAGLPTSEVQHHDDKKDYSEDLTEPVVTGVPGELEEMDSELIPTEEDMLTLRKVAAPLP